MASYALQFGLTFALGATGWIVTMDEFLLAFWPNLASTVIGVALGVPIALYLNRELTRQGRAHEEAHQASLLHRATRVLIESCDYNVRVLKAIVELSAHGEIMRRPDLRTTTWDALSGVVTNHLEDPELLQLISHHWLRLKRLEELNAQTFSMEVGQSPRPEGRVSLESFIGELHMTANDLANHAAEIAAKLRSVANEPGA